MKNLINMFAKLITIIFALTGIVYHCDDILSMKCFIISAAALLITIWIPYKGDKDGNK